VFINDINEWQENYSYILLSCALGHYQRIRIWPLFLSLPNLSVINLLTIHKHKQLHLCTCPQTLNRTILYYQMDYFFGSNYRNIVMVKMQIYSPAFCSRSRYPTYKYFISIRFTKETCRRVKDHVVTSVCFSHGGTKLAVTYAYEPSEQEESTLKMVITL
jgi:hypothetical protein